jgi:hypothetical protein
MNDFTLEDLERIYECVDSDYHHSNWPKSKYDPLIYKIQSMIDNYKEDCTKSWPSNMIKPCPDCKRFHSE